MGEYSVLNTISALFHYKCKVKVNFENLQKQFSRISLKFKHIVVPLLLIEELLNKKFSKSSKNVIYTQ